MTGLLITGTSVAPSFRAPSGWDWVLLPGVDKGLDGYVPRNLEVSMHDLVALRAGMIDGVLAGFRPDLIVVDRHATGIHGELATALRRARATSAVRVVLGLREVLDGPEAALAEWARLGGPGVIKELFDGIWIYGDPAVHDPVEAGEVPWSLRRLIHYTGYLATGRPTGSGVNCMPGPYCMTTVGGGSDGHALARVAALTPMPAGLGHLIVTGPQMPDKERRDIAQLARNGATVVAMVDDVVHHMRQAAAVVSMGGYNSVCEIMSTDVPALIVPRSQPRAEQRIRAGSLARAGYVDYQEIGTLTPEVLSSWLSSQLGTTIDRRRLQLNGLARVPQLAAEQLAAEQLAGTLAGVPAGRRRMAARVKVALSRAAI
ncbi:glycosyltransferase family protein [Pseudarthrobacter sp. P1]|uniref:glycosyltransferase family protein n=1 Tax=Pseudarthrobacter sp. P1 TaxID=3418418 RepID=UPI003CF8FFF1